MGRIGARSEHHEKPGASAHRRASARRIAHRGRECGTVSNDATSTSEMQGALAEFVALGSAGCYLGPVRLHDFEVTMPAPVDLATINVGAFFAVGSTSVMLLEAYYFQSGATLTISWDAP